jgi:hypothetical protein
MNSIGTALKNEGLTEPYDLEPWFASNQEIIGQDFMILGRQVPTRSGPNPIPGIDKTRNLQGFSGIRRAK